MQLSEKAQATREKILEAANALFFQHGYHATGLDKVIKTAGVTKGNFYYYFKSKEELAVQTLQWHFNKTVESTKETVLSKRLSPLKTLFAILEMMAIRQKQQESEGNICGCYFGNFTLELSAESTAVRKKVKYVFDQFLKNFQTLLEAAQAAGEIPASIDPQQASSIILSLMEGAILLDKADQHSRHIDNNIAFIRQYLLA